MSATARRAAHKALKLALIDGPPPLCKPEHATSEREAVRARVAAEVCPRCPYLVLCREAGKFERWHVWGGVDRTAKQRPRT